MNQTTSPAPPKVARFTVVGAFSGFVYGRLIASFYWTKLGSSIGDWCVFGGLLIGAIACTLIGVALRKHSHGTVLMENATAAVIGAGFGALSFAIAGDFIGRDTGMKPETWTRIALYAAGPAGAALGIAVTTLKRRMPLMGQIATASLVIGVLSLIFLAFTQ